MCIEVRQNFSHWVFHWRKFDNTHFWLCPVDTQSCFFHFISNSAYFGFVWLILVFLGNLLVPSCNCCLFSVDVKMKFNLNFIYSMSESNREIPKTCWQFLYPNWEFSKLNWEFTKLNREFPKSNDNFLNRKVLKIFQFGLKKVSIWFGNTYLLCFGKFSTQLPANDTFFCISIPTAIHWVFSYSNMYLFLVFGYQRPHGSRTLQYRGSFVPLPCSKIRPSPGV